MADCGLGDSKLQEFPGLPEGFLFLLKKIKKVEDNASNFLKSFHCSAALIFMFHRHIHFSYIPLSNYFSLEIIA